MRRSRTKLRNKDLVAGCACGVLCAACVGFYVLSITADAKAAEAQMLSKYGGEQVQACVARHDIAAGQTIAESDLEERTWVASLLPSDAVTARQDAVGKQVGSTILAGEVISAARFGFNASSIDVPNGMYAVSVPAREVQAVGGALTPGVSVDVFAIGGTSTVRIAASALVLATSAAQDSRNAGTDAWVTLAVEPALVQEVVQAAEGQTLYFALPAKDAAHDQGEEASTNAKGDGGDAQ